jgi:N-acetylmuramoyl-L-alanine amidase
MNAAWRRSKPGRKRRDRAAAGVAWLLAAAALAPAAARGTNAVTGLSVKDHETFTAVTVKLQKPTTFNVTKMKDGRLALVIKDCTLKPSAIKWEKAVGAVKKVTSANVKGAAWIYVTLTKDAKSYEGTAIKKPPQVYFKVYKKEKKPPAGTAEVPPVKAAKGEFPTSARDFPPDATPTVIDTICIDPGHGGRFSGAEGPKGTVEKDVNLDISLRLARLLRDKLGVRVVMTRTDDSHVYMRDRTGLANEVKADLFIDVHNNAVLNAKVGGTETYFLSEARSDWERAASMSENQDFLAENPNFTADAGNLNFILSLLAQNEFLQESSELAHSVQQNLGAALALRDRGVKQAPFYVLVGCACPSILVEIAFISNGPEEKLLTDPEFQQKAAEAIFAAIKAYKEQYEARVNRGG